MAGRYAVYYAPERDSMLDLFGKQFIGRCAETGKCFDQPTMPSLGLGGLEKLTGSPRFYGFHGTLVPPFHLKIPYTAGDLVEHALGFSGKHQSFDLGQLAIKEIGTFIALVPVDTHRVTRLAEACLRSFHPLREAPSLAEMERRRSKGLTANQERLLANWGYPYVLDEFRFHLTLTDSIRDAGLRKRVVKELNNRTASLRKIIHPLRELCIFHQPDKSTEFSLIKRIPLGK